VELARKSGIDRTTISALENNRLFLSIHYALRLKELLGCSLDDLYERITDDAESRKAKRRNATRARA
jgi:DNA-binding XRE family transcriptional regulator